VDTRRPFLEISVTVVEERQGPTRTVCREKQIEVAIAIEVHKVQTAQPPLGMTLVLPGQRVTHARRRRCIRKGTARRHCRGFFTRGIANAHREQRQQSRCASENAFGNYSQHLRKIDC
jgi:hypothetical protein